jgi:hypothetical protein
VQALLLQVAAQLAQQPAPIGLPPTRIKVSKGENYRGLPYWVLDYPAHFNQADVFAYRSICHWGHGFSFTLHLAGQYLLQHKEALLANYGLLYNQPSLYLCVNTSPWEHHFEKDNYQLFNEVVLDAAAWEAFMDEREFVKLAFNLPLEEWDNVVERGEEIWGLWAGVLV